MWNIPKLQRFIKRLPEPMALRVTERVFNYCVVGGTFDHFHIGHKTLITTATLFSRKILLCITSDEYVKNMRKIASDLIEPFAKRQQNVAFFLRDIECMDMSILCSIDDPYSTAINSPHAEELDSIMISKDPDVMKRTEKLNLLRIEKNLRPLKIIRIPLILDPYGEVFSSTRYRLNNYFPEPRPPELRLNKEVIEEIRRPKGPTVDSPMELPNPERFFDRGIIVIGDTAFRNLVSMGYPISVAILDFKAKRENLSYTVEYPGSSTIEAVPAIPTFNPPSSISTYTWFSVMVAFVQRSPTIVRVFGEEDLLGFPATLLAPIGSLVIYGDPFLDKLVYYVVNEYHKDRALKLLSKMTVSSQNDP